MQEQMWGLIFEEWDQYFRSFAAKTSVLSSIYHNQQAQ